jgi:hypothetical protein
VTVDGKLLDSGEIQFQPTGGIGPTGGGRIEKGRYEARLSPGAKTVRIRGYEQVGVGHYSNGGEYPIRRQFLPARYNDATTLEAMIGPDRSQVNFALESR